MLSYVKDTEAIQQRLQPSGLQFVDSMEKSGIRCLLAERDDTLVICFRGTEVDSLQNILTDVHVTFSDWMRGQVHTGFKKAWEQIAEWLDHHLKQRARHKLLFAGHSLGGALALLGADTYSSRDPVVYSYGAPKTGDATFASGVTATHYRIVHNSDVVPMAPPGKLYQHDSNRLYIDAKGELHTEPPTKTVIKSHLQGHLQHAAEVFGAWKSKNLTALPNANLVDHVPCFYVKALYELNRREET